MPRRRALVAEAWCWLAAVRIGVVLLGWRRTRRLVGRRPRAPSLARPLVLAALRSATRRFPGRPNCLVRSLAAEAFLRRHGHPVELRLGVRHDPAGRLEAHAWTEARGTAVFGVRDGFVPLEASP